VRGALAGAGSRAAALLLPLAGCCCRIPAARAPGVQPAVDAIQAAVDEGKKVRGRAVVLPVVCNIQSLPRLVPLAWLPPVPPCSSPAAVQVVVHCWGGGGRAGMVLAAWLAKQQGERVTPEQAASQVVEAAAAAGAQRRVDLGQLGRALAG
jgi:hypothetical protein